MSDPIDKPRFVYVTYVATTPEKLWQALTTASLLDGIGAAGALYLIGRSVRRLNT